MSFLEKMGLVERVNPNPLPKREYVPEEEAEEEVIVETDNVSSDNFVSDVYAENNLSDLSKSIFKVEEISNNLPDTMTKATKQASVLGILSSFGLTVDGVKEDAENRKTILSAALEKITEEHNDIIVKNQAEIENAKMLIETCQKGIAECEKVVKDSTDKVENEVKRIAGLVDFIKEEQK